MKLVHLASRRSAARRSLWGIIALTLAVLTAVLAGINGVTQLAAIEALRSLAVASGAQAVSLRPNHERSKSRQLLPSSPPSFLEPRRAPQV